MKKITNILSYALFIIVLSACADNNDQILDEELFNAEFDSSKSFENQILSIPNNDFENSELILAYSEIMIEVLQMSKDNEFRNYVFQSAKESNSYDEDYVIDLGIMTKKLQNSEKFGKSSAKLSAMVSKVQSINSEDLPMVFYPKAETLEDNLAKNKEYNVEKNLNEPIAVLKGAYYDDYTAPGYKLSDQGNLVYDRMVDEEYAWNNDVYVIGNAEIISLPASTQLLCAGNPIQKTDCGGGSTGGGGSSGGTGTSSYRINGRSEYGGIVQATDLNAIESWFSGKLEFRMVIAGVSGSAGTVIKDISWGRVSRSDFKDRKVKDFNTFLFNWNTSNLGQWQVEKWIEMDGGSSASTTITLPGQPATSTSVATPTYSVTVPSQNLDDDLGTSIVQFTDKLSQQYPITYMNFRRK